MTRRPCFPGLGGLLALACATVGCGPSAPPVAETPPPPVSVSHPVVRQVQDLDDYEGRIGAVKKVEVRARVRGHLMKIHFKDGAIVKEGELLYEIDPRPAQASLDAARAQQKSAEASLHFARAEYKRTRELVARGAASREELESWIAKQEVAEGDLSKAKAAVEQAELDLSFTRVTAPVTGQISRTQVDEGNLINAGGGETLLTTIVSIDPVYVYFNVDERSLLRYRKQYLKGAKAGEPLPDIKALHLPVTVALDGEDGFPHTGEINFADNRVNSGTGTIPARAILPNRQHLLNDGMRARVRVPIGERHQALLVTERALGNDQGKKFLYVVDAHSVAQRRDVELGRVLDGLQAIQSGLQPEDWVVVNGIQRVREGMKMKLNEVPMPGVEPGANSAQQPATK